MGQRGQRRAPVGAAIAAAALGFAVSNAERGVPARAAEVGMARAMPAGEADLGTRLDAALHGARVAAGAPDATAAVARCGALQWVGADGITDRASRRPARVTDRFVVASSTKTVVAVLVLRLVQDGRLALDTPLSRFYPRLPHARDITLRMLLDHTSGLNEYFDDARISRVIATQPRHRWTRSEVLRGITRTLFPPGSRTAYSNSAYVVLGGILEQVTHRSVEDLFQSVIARPLHLSRSTFDYRPQLSGLFAHPYVGPRGRRQDAYVPHLGIAADYWGQVWTDGGLASTSPDLARFGAALLDGRLLQAGTLVTMRRANRFGTRLGLDAQRQGGRTWLGHNGRYGGYESEVWTDARRGLTVVVNTDSERSSLRVWRALAATYDRHGPPTDTVCPGSHPPARVAATPAAS